MVSRYQRNEFSEVTSEIQKEKGHKDKAICCFSFSFIYLLCVGYCDLFDEKLEVVFEKKKAAVPKINKMDLNKNPLASSTKPTIHNVK